MGADLGKRQREWDLGPVSFMIFDIFARARVEDVADDVTSTVKRRVRLEVHREHAFPGLTFHLEIDLVKKSREGVECHGERFSLETLPASHEAPRHCEWEARARSFVAPCCCGTPECRGTHAWPICSACYEAGRHPVSDERLRAPSRPSFWDRFGL